VFSLGTVSSGSRAAQRVAREQGAHMSEHQAYKLFASIPPSCIEQVDALAANGAGEVSHLPLTTMLWQMLYSHQTEPASLHCVSNRASSTSLDAAERTLIHVL